MCLLSAAARRADNTSASEWAALTAGREISGANGGMEANELHELYSGLHM